MASARGRAAAAPARAKPSGASPPEPSRRSCSVSVGAWFGWRAALLVFLALPVFGFLALWIADSHRLSWTEARRYVVVRTNRRRVAAMRARQRALAERLRHLFAHRMPE